MICLCEILAATQTVWKYVTESHGNHIGAAIDLCDVYVATISLSQGHVTMVHSFTVQCMAVI
jgi:hypothetical protein